MTAKKPDYPADDPYGHITEALSMGESFQGARELFLAWVLRLPEGLEPHIAADNLLTLFAEQIATIEAKNTTPELMQLIAMLREAKEKPMARPRRRKRLSDRTQH